MNTKLLDKKFTKKGEVFTQVEKGETYYIYKRDMQCSICYEVFARKVVILNDFWRQFDKNGKYNGFDTIELYPSDEQFGKWAYCCSNLEKAQKLAKEFIN